MPDLGGGCPECSPQVIFERTRHSLSTCNHRLDCLLVATLKPENGSLVFITNSLNILLKGFDVREARVDKHQVSPITVHKVVNLLLLLRLLDLWQTLLADDVGRDQIEILARLGILDVVEHRLTAK